MSATVRRSHRPVPSHAVTALAAVALLAGCSGAVPSASGTASPSAVPSSPATAVPTASTEPTDAEPTPGVTSTPYPSYVVEAPWAADEWMPIPLVDPLVVPLGGGRLVVLGPDPLLTWGRSTGERATTVQVRDAAGSWSTGASLTRSRSLPAVVALADGRVLLAGGARAWSALEGDRGASYSSTWIYDPATDAWTRSGLLATARADAAIARLRDGRVLVAGGFFWAYEPAGQAAGSGGSATLASWRAPGDDDPAPLADVDPEPVGHALATAEVWDPRTGAWTTTGPMRWARSGASAVTLADGRVLVVGSSGTQFGVRIPEGAATTAEIWDPATGRFTPAGDLPAWDSAAISAAMGMEVDFDRWGQQAATGTLVALPDGGALLAGQWDTWKHTADATRSFRWNARTGTWTETGPTWASAWDENHDRGARLDGVPLADPSAVLLADGRIAVAGQHVALERPDARPETIVAFDPGSGTWTTLATLPLLRSSGALVADARGHLLVLGGVLLTGSPAEWTEPPAAEVLRLDTVP